MQEILTKIVAATLNAIGTRGSNPSVQQQGDVSHYTTMQQLPHAAFKKNETDLHVL